MGCCPDFDPETGAQLNMVCVCGAKLPPTSAYSICQGCMTRAAEEDGGEDLSEDDEDDFEDDNYNDLADLDDNVRDYEADDY